MDIRFRDRAFLALCLAASLSLPVASIFSAEIAGEFNGSSQATRAASLSTVSYSSTAGISDQNTDAASAPEDEMPIAALPGWQSAVYQPRWSARVGALFLQRARPEPTPFVYDANTGAPIVNPANFDFPFRAGADVGLIRYGQQADFDFRYFGVNQASASQGPFAVGPGAALAIPGSGGGSSDPLSINSTYVSSLNSVEANLRRNISPRWALLTGLRYVSFTDRLSAMAFDAVSDDTSNIRFATTNNLFGAQIGAAGVLWGYGQRFRIESAVKAGVYANGAHSTISNSDNSGSFSLGTGHDHTAFVGDLNFSGVYQISDRWAVRAGYQLLWLSGVAVASEQLHSINFGNNGSFTTNTSHGVFFHGALVSLERCW